jgi:hypothetical protein
MDFERLITAATLLELRLATVSAPYQPPTIPVRKAFQLFDNIGQQPQHTHAVHL